MLLGQLALLLASTEATIVASCIAEKERGEEKRRRRRRNESNNDAEAGPCRESPIKLFSI